MNNSQSEKERIAAVPGLFTIDDPPHLIGGRMRSSVAYCFPKDLGGSDPSVSIDQVEEVLLSRKGIIWSYTNSVYSPPPPFVVREPYESITVAAVELEAERMIILGQVAPGWGVDDLEIGMAVELCLGILYEDENREYLTWQWRPITTSEMEATSG